ncbi:hypothetical protein EDD18DRAFT_1167474 [Armillaria luteobubalina]|uniref:Fungal-type protein kinase domain-containing protein n=1 Tax=Armillaria luteobubalina TaxID=153913 RepID=A0AA39UMT1_9AGAR|nr:hypothetical protein EDD18DRAFT_1167474 [Armillaria luteobubalina]
MEGHWIGPMPVEEFLEEHMGASNGPFTPRSPGHLHNIFESIKAPSEHKSEKAYAEAVASVIQSTADLMPQFKYVLGKENKGTISTITIITDAFIYKTDVDTESRPIQWSKVELWLEFKRIPSVYGFEDNERKEWVSQTEASKKCRGLLGTYAANTLNTQHRRHLFSLNLGLDGVRFFRWERTHTVVSRAFDLSTDGKYLVEFFHRYSTMTDGDRGLDETVTPATKEERSLAVPLLEPWIHSHGKDQWEFVKILVPDKDGGERAVIAGPVLAAPYSISGRATLGLPVYDIRTKKLCFLKDSWRDVNLPDESNILQTLNDAKVRNVPTLVCGGVVRGQITTSQKYIKAPWNRGAHPSLPCTREHQRTLTEEVGHPLKKFKSSKQLTRVVYEAFLGHKDALTICKILHRDVSGGNILIVYDEKVPENIHDGGGRGLLNDWDMAIHMDDLDKPARQAERTGTWQFMSIALLDQTTKKHEPQDDFESFIYVMLYYDLRYLPHNEVGPGLKNLVSFIFDLSIELGNGHCCGGPTKCSLVHRLSPLRPDFRFGCSPFNIWIRQMLSATNQWQMVRTQQTALPEETPLRLVEPTRIIDPEKAVFYDHSRLEVIWKKVLEMDGWPTDDQATYQLELSGIKRPREDSNQPVQKKYKSGRSTAAAASDTSAA